MTAPAAGQWLTILKPGGAWVWPLRGDEALQELEALINAARVVAEFPPTSTWVSDGSGHRVEIGEPSAAVMARATVGTLDDLARVDARAVADYADARRANKRRARVDAVKAGFVGLDEAGRAEVIAAVPAGSVSTVRGR